MVATTAMVAIAFLIPLGLLVQQLAHERALAGAERQTAIVVSVLAVTTDEQAVEEVVMAARDDSPGDGRLAIHGLAGGTVGAGRAADSDVRLAADQQQSVVASASGGLAYLEPVEVADGQAAVVEAYVPAVELTAGVREAWWALAAVALGLMVGSVVVGDRLAARVVRPARRLAGAAVALGEGNLDVRVSPSGPRELAGAGAAFNQMADRLSLLRTTERETVADLSHRLRTPLTGLRLDVDALDGAEQRPAPDDEADRHRTVARIRQAVATLEHEIDVLIRTTRQAASATTEDAPTDPSRCDAGKLVRARLQFWSAVAADQERTCQVSVPAVTAPVPVPAAELAAALDSVLGNAFRYTPQGTAVQVAVTRHEGWVAVRVDDAGDGIPDPDHALRRGASGRGSTGLGMDIARRVAEAGGGFLSVDRGQLGGASVVMVFADAEVPPRQPSRLGLIGRLTREPRPSHWPRPRRPRE